MKFNYGIYQLDPNNENVRKEHKMFESWEILNKFSSFNLSEYKRVYGGSVELNDFYDEKEKEAFLEELFERFNLTHPDGFTGHSLSVSDVVIIMEDFYYCDSFGWVKIA